MRVLTHCGDMVLLTMFLLKIRWLNTALAKDSFCYGFCYISADLSVSANKKGTPQRAFFLFELPSIFPLSSLGIFHQGCFPQCVPQRKRSPKKIEENQQPAITLQSRSSWPDDRFLTPDGTRRNAQDRYRCNNHRHKSRRPLPPASADAPAGTGWLNSDRHAAETP